MLITDIPAMSDRDDCGRRCQQPHVERRAGDALAQRDDGEEAVTLGNVMCMPRLCASS